MIDTAKLKAKRRNTMRRRSFLKAGAGVALTGASLPLAAPAIAQARGVTVTEQGSKYWAALLPAPTGR